MTDFKVGDLVEIAAEYSITAFPISAAMGLSLALELSGRVGRVIDFLNVIGVGGENSSSLSSAILVEVGDESLRKRIPVPREYLRKLL